MTFLGKILTVVIFAFSLVLMSLALMVGATHKNWYELVNNPPDKATATNPAGLVHRLKQAQEENDRLRGENDRLNRAIASEEVARRVEVAKLESLRQNLAKQLADLQTQHNAEVAALAKANETLKVAEDELAKKQVALDKLREEIRVAQAERDKTLTQIADASDKNHQLSLTLTNLQRRGVELSSQIASLRGKLAAYNIPENADVSRIPPRVEGKITAVRNNGQEISVVVSVGKDDGLKEGHQMNVFRGGELIGRISLRQVDPDRSVGESDPVFYKRPFQRGDIARTITPSASLDRQADARR